MVDSILVEQGGKLLMMMGGSGVAGFIMGYAIKKVMKIVAIIGGLIIALLAFLEMKGMISVQWDVVTHETYNAANQTLQTVGTMAQHVSDKVSGLESGAAIGGSVFTFMACFLYGLKRG